MKRRLLFLAILGVLILLTWGVSLAESHEVTVRVGILMDQTAVGLTCSKPLTVKNGYSLKEILTTGGRVVIKVHQGQIYVNDRPAGCDHVYVLTSDFHTPIYLNDVPYRGYFMAGKNDKGRLMLVNHVGMEDYLGGVLGGEIIQSWPIEAIKAQAVAARTYALYKLQGSKERLYDLVNSDADQVYLGVRGESSRFNEALRQTRSQVLSRDGQVICAYYHSNSGGHTSDSMTVFKRGHADLKGVEDPYARGAPNESWTYTVRSETIRNLLSRNGYPVGKIFTLNIKSRCSGGRIIDLEVEHEKGKTVVHGSDFRRILGYRNLKSTRTTLHPSQFYTHRYTRMMSASRGAGGAGDVPTTDFVKVPEYFTFKGSGWGHGVGMSQWSARNMALAGYNYRQILAHFYRDTVLSVARKK